MVFTTTGEGGERQVWVASLDRSSAPRLIAQAADSGRFLDAGRVALRSPEGHENFIDRMGTDGTMRARVVSTPVMDLQNASPDGRWVLAIVPLSGEAPSPATVAAPIAEGAPRLVCDLPCRVSWSPDGRHLYLSEGVAEGRRPVTVVPVPGGQVFPEFPADGSPARHAWAKLPGAQALQREDFVPGADVSTYVFVKSDELRNLYRVLLTDR